MSTTVATIRRRLLGLLLVGILVGGIALSVAIYNRAFTEQVTVRVQAGAIGNQLAPNSDVKVRGLIIGRVGDIEATPTGTELVLHLDPEQAKLVPANTSARFLPKTLFGERYVDLDIPERPAPASLSDGTVITQDRTEDAVRLEQALDNLLPVLQAVQPEKLSSTLSAISTALEGRGEQLGETLSELGAYLRELNPHVPALQENLRELAEFSGNLSDVAPDLLTTLDNLSATSRTVVEQRYNLDTMYRTVTAASSDLDTFLDANKSNLIGLGRTARPTAELLAAYAPSYPCFLGQMAELVPRIDESFGKGTGKPGLHATLEITVDRGPYKAGQDEPEYNDKRGPRCYDMDEYPDPFPQYPPDGPPKDGTEHPSAAETSATGLNNFAGGAAAPAGNPANTAGEYALVAQLAGPRVGLAPSEVPAWGSLLVAPLYRGAEVTVE
ncbi:MCE family protein [Saccharomonospora xinjiangensis]|uniref:ABC-type transport system involved in resistance to organic solvents, periplasmic component n=1 Tax=Saccharomonospora xinjiangensis XJ-54 TaxID=882086 RepID=I0V184_9PSEU|nr:MCE family protein [Saccharomonospora xinjiangensis]EID53887.1 ABC-type transport system involved in resistance to organic solvents, periplasmic component [Saccharomonospora xinjiangensis XJ-54]